MDKFIFSTRTVSVSVLVCCCCSSSFLRVSISIVSMARLTSSKAFLKSPVCAATFFEHSWIAAGWTKGTKFESSGEESTGRSDFRRLVITLAICVALYGKKGRRLGFKFLAFNFGRARSVKSKALAIPISIRRDFGCSDHSKSDCKISESAVRR